MPYNSMMVRYEATTEDTLLDAVLEDERAELLAQLIDMNEGDLDDDNSCPR